MKNSLQGGSEAPFTVLLYRSLWLARSVVIASADVIGFKSVFGFSPRQLLGY
jgi:hypothetical protein